MRYNENYGSGVSFRNTQAYRKDYFCAEPLSVELFLASPAMEKQVAAVESEAQFTAHENPKLVLPTGATGTVSKAMSD